MKMIYVGEFKKITLLVVEGLSLVFDLLSSDLRFLSLQI